MGRACPQALRHDADVIALSGVMVSVGRKKVEPDGHVGAPGYGPKKGNLRQSGVGKQRRQFSNIFRGASVRSSQVASGVSAPAHARTRG